MPAPVRLSVMEQAGEVVLAVTGRLDAQGAGAIWNAALRAGAAARGRPLAIDLSAASFCDLDGATLLAAAEAAHGEPATLRGASGHVAELLARARTGVAAPVPPPPASHAGPRETLAAGMASVTGAIAYLGETAIALVHLPLRRRMFRIADFLLYVLQSGARSLPLAMLLGYLMGLILAFQSEVPMRRFGADLFVADLVTIGLVRELGPLLAAVILAGRTGSAFAAEIGTMKVNQEVDALATMGIDPMTNLVLPRLAAVMLVMPVVTLVLELRRPDGHDNGDAAFGFPHGDHPARSAERRRPHRSARRPRQVDGVSVWPSRRSAAGRAWRQAWGRARWVGPPPPRWWAASSPPSRWTACSRCCSIGWGCEGRRFTLPCGRGMAPGVGPWGPSV